MPITISNLGRHQGGMAACPFVLAHVMKCWTREATIDMCRGQNNAAARRPKKVSAGRQPAATAAVILQRAALAAAPLRTWPLWSPLSFCLTLSLGVIRFCYASVCLLDVTFLNVRVESVCDCAEWIGYMCLELQLSLWWYLAGPLAPPSVWKGATAPTLARLGAP